MSSVGKHLLKVSLQSVARNNVTGLGVQTTYQRSPRGIVSSAPARSSGYDSDGKTTVQILNQEADAGLMFDSYSQLGFRLNNGMVVLGPVAIFPRSVLSWNVGCVGDIDSASLILFSLLAPKIDILVLGVGDRTDVRLGREMAEFQRRTGISVETLPTEQACATFNFLNSEGRYVAGAMIPPETFRHTDDDVVLSKMRQRRLYGPDSEDALV